MKTLFVEKKSMELRYERACLLLYHEGKRVSSVPLTQIERIVVAPHVALSAGVLGVVAENEVSLMVINSRYPDRTALLTGKVKGDTYRRLAQYRLHSDANFRIKWSIFLVRVKIARHCRLLLKLSVRRPEYRFALMQGVGYLSTCVAELESHPPLNLETLRGKEGAAAAYGA